MMAGEAVQRAAKSGVLKGLRAEKTLAVAFAMRKAIKIAVANKVQIALGTDAGVMIDDERCRTTARLKTLPVQNDGRQ
jgi:imidazolonepropionase-like amidohydrolase